MKANVKEINVDEALSTEKEIWKDIEGYEGLYQVSNLGRVKSIRGSKLVKHQYYGNSKSTAVKLSKKGQETTFYIARLVTQTFPPNFEIKGRHVYRLDGDKYNNHFSNFYVKPSRDERVGYIKSLERKKITKDMLSELSLEDYIGEVVLITVNIVAKKHSLNRMFNLDDLKSYLVIQAMEIVQKFDPEKCVDGWATLGQYLYKVLQGRAINFKKAAFKLNGHNAVLDHLAEDKIYNGDENPVDNASLKYQGSEDSGYSEVLGTDMMTVLSDELSPFQLDILKGRLEGKSDSEIGRALGVHSMKVYREMKKVQAIAIELGFLN